MARSCSANLPGGVRVVSTDAAGDGYISKPANPIPERVLTFGATYGKCYDVGYKEFTLVAATPADIDLAASTALDGSNLTGLAGKLVYLDCRITSGPVGAATDCKFKPGSSNGIAITDGTTDSIPCLGHQTLVDHLENDGYTSFEAALPAFDATHKTIRGTSASGCSGYFVIIVK